MRDPVTAYARRLAAGKVPACKWHRFAGVRHLHDLERQRTRHFPYWFDLDEADRRIRFFTKLRHFKGEWAGQPIVLRPWEAFIVGSVFGWRRVEDDLRRFRRALLFTPRGQGKSTLMAGVGIQLLGFDAEPAAEVYPAATKREQSKIIFKYAREMVIRSKGLKKRIWPGKHALVHERSASTFQPLGADADTLDGLRPSGGLIDEYHAHKDGAIIAVIETGMGTRRQPLLFIVTTAGENIESVCYTEYEDGCRIVDPNSGVTAEKFFVFITGIDEGDDWTQPATWRKANPNYGISVKVDDLQEACAMARRQPRKRAEFLRKHLNVWTQQHEIWIALEKWDACKGTFSAPTDALAVAAGLDLSSKLDLTAFVVVLKYPDSRPPEQIVIGGTTSEIDGRAIPTEVLEADTAPRTLNVDFRIEIVPFFWLPKDTLIERVRDDRIRYDIWAEEKYLHVTPGETVDYNIIYDDVVRDLGPRFRLKGGQIGFDPYNATQFTTQLHERAGYTCVEVGQNVRQLSEPAKLLEALVNSGRVTHSGHPVLRMCVANVGVREDKKGNIFPFKTGKTKRIDGVSATLNAINRLIVMPEPKPSVYKTRGALVLTRRPEPEPEGPRP